MKQRSEKQKDLEQLKSDLAKVSTVILTTFQGITVEQDTKLRRAVQSAGGRYPVALAKALTKIAKDVPAFKFRAGIVEGRVLSIEQIQQLSQLPSKEELIGKIMFLLQAPAQRMASALAALPRNLAVTVNEAVKANKFSSGGGSPEAIATGPEATP